MLSQVNLSNVLGYCIFLIRTVVFVIPETIPVVKAALIVFLGTVDEVCA